MWSVGIEPILSCEQGMYPLGPAVSRTRRASPPIGGLLRFVFLPDPGPSFIGELYGVAQVVNCRLALSLFLIAEADRFQNVILSVIEEVSE